MRYYLYKNHLDGGLWVSEYEEDTPICSSCGDSNTELGRFESKYDLVEYLRGEIDFAGSGGYSLEYLEKLLDGIEDDEEYNEENYL